MFDDEGEEEEDNREIPSWVYRILCNKEATGPCRVSEHFALGQRSWQHTVKRGVTKNGSRYILIEVFKDQTQQSDS